MYMQMALALFRGYYVDLDAYFAATPAAVNAANAAGTPHPPALAAGAAPTPQYIVDMTDAIEACINAGVAVPAGTLPAGETYTGVHAMNTVLTQYTAEQLAYYGERIWEQNRVPLLRNVLPEGNLNLHEGWSLLTQTADAGTIPQPPNVGYWRHLVYAYLLECTNLASVFQRVVHEWVHGERLPFATLPTQMWLRTTEQLFFTNPQPPSVRSLTSDIRPDRGAVRRNAYYRLMGLELPLSAADGRSTAYLKPDAANRNFVRAWEQLLYEVWHAYVHLSTTSGPNPTDPIALDELVRELREMLVARRAYGNLSREEFEAVSYFSWFHVTVAGNTQVVQDLTAQSTSAAMRLKKIGERVGVGIHSKSDSFFQMADNMADVLEAIETGALDGNTDALYDSTIAGNFVGQMLMLITHWGAATGRSVKGTDVRALPSIPAVASPVSLMMPATSRFQPAVR